MHTRSCNASSASSSSSQSYRSRQSLPLPSVRTRTRKRKSSVLQEDDVCGRVQTVQDELKVFLNETSLYNGRRGRHSLSSADLTKYMTSIEEPTCPRRRFSRHAVRSYARHSLQLQQEVDSVEEDVEVVENEDIGTSNFRRRLVDDYESRSNVSSGSSAVSAGSSSVASYCTRLSSRRSQSDKDSIVSGLSHISSSNRSQNGTNNLGFRNGREQEGEVEEELESEISTQYDGIRKATRPSPLPTVCFAACEELWELMCAMDLKYHKPPEVFQTNPVLSPQMRAILIDWMMDVCEAYKMHRETLYLAVDYLDRYLASQSNIAKTVLQLIGITCLFVAAKLEEIYPPKLKTFAYVTDGACTESEILDMELILMKTLKWKLTPITPVGWISIYLQVLAYRRKGIYCTRSGADSFLRSTLRQNRPDDNRLVKHYYDTVEFVRTVRLVDMAILDYQSLQYSYSTLATAALYHIKGRAAALSVSGFKWDHIASCVNWMDAFALVLKRNDIASVLPSIDGVCDENRHLVHSHCVNLDLVADAERMRTSKVFSPLTHTGLLTPPRSSEKYRKSLSNGKHH